jgi:small-conductance mechanosensitive channel
MLDRALAWLSEGRAGRNLLILVAGYVVALVVTLVILAVMLATLPPNYFRDDFKETPLRNAGPLGAVKRVIKNTIGLALIVLGALLSLPGIPGQGVLTMLVGLMLVDFPGKRTLERKLVARAGVLETMNRVRAWLGRPPLVR